MPRGRDTTHRLAYRPDIDGLRAIAVTAVVVFHAFPGAFSGGFTGVDVFFVISGYLISKLIWTELAETGGFRLRHFYARRIIRLFPALTVVVVTCLVAGWWLLTPHDYGTLGKDAAAAAGYVSNIVFWRDSGYFAGPASLRPLTHLWSLGVEEQFYVLYPLIVLLCHRLRVTAVVLPLLLVASFAVNLASVSSHPNAAFYLLPARFWELLLGGLLAYAQLRRPDWWDGRSRSIRGVAGLVGIALIGLALFAASSQGYPGWWAVAPTVGSLLVIAAGADSRLNLLLGRRPLVQIGLISYPIYLWHFPLIVFTRLQSPTRTLSLWTALGLIAATVVLAALTYRLVEQPIRARRARVSWRPIPILVASLVAVGCAGAFVAHASGFPKRLPYPAQRLLTYTYDYKTAYRERTCSIDPDQGPGSFAPSCVDANGPSPEPLVVLWGDSHAAHLYPGLRALKSTWRFRIAEFASSSCPPLLHYSSPDRPHCSAINPFVLEKIRELHPLTVILSAAWDQYVDVSGLVDTVTAVRRAGVRHVVVAGPTPKWTNGLPQAVYDLYKSDPSLGLAKRLTLGMSTAPQTVDPVVRALARRAHAVYVDPVHALCNDEGCLARLGNGISQITIWDSQHYTTAGSTFVARAFTKQLMAGIRRR